MRGSGRSKACFGLVPDYAEKREGGSTDLALVPSLNALLFLMRSFGFTKVQFSSTARSTTSSFAAVRGSSSTARRDLC